MSNLVVKRAGDLTTKEAEWLIEGVLPVRSLCFLSAPPKLGKTMVALELSTALASGKKAFGMYNVPRKGKVLYFAGEDAEGGFKKRIDQFAGAKGASTEQLDIYTVTEQSLFVDTPEGQAALCAAIESVKPDLLVLDNLSRIHHSNENSADAMGMIFEFLQTIKLKYGVSILLVHHMGKDGTLRGSSQIDSFYEAAIFLKARDGIRLADFKFRNHEERTGVQYQIKTDEKGMRVVLSDGIIEERIKPLPQVIPKVTAQQAIARTLNLSEALSMGNLNEVRSGVYRRVS